MEKSDDISKIMPALVAAQSEFVAVSKGGDNKFDGYKYAKLEDYIKAAMPVLVKHKLAIITGSTSHTEASPRMTKKGDTQPAMMVEIELILTHESGQWISVKSVGEGQDRGDKSTYKALTGARKYGVAMLLGLITTDDPEASSPNGHTNQPPSAGTPTPPIDDFLGATQ